MSLSIITLKQQAKKFDISGLGEIMIRKMTIGDNVKVQSWMNENKDENDNVTMDRFMMMKCLSCMVTEEGDRIEIADANGNAITDDNLAIDAVLDLLPAESVHKLFKSCNEVNVPPKSASEEVSEKKSKS